MRGSGDSRGPVHHRCVVVVTIGLRRAGVHTDPDAHRHRPTPPANCALDLDRRRDPLLGIDEHRHEPIARRLHDRAVALLDDAPYECIVFRGRGAHRVGVLFPQERAAVDVGEEKGDDTRR